MTQKSQEQLKKEAFQKLIEKACPEGVKVVLNQEEPNQEKSEKKNGQTFDFNEVGIEVEDPDFTVDDKELILRRIRRALMASTSTSSAEGGTSELVEIGFNKEEISLENPLTVKIMVKYSNALMQNYEHKVQNYEHKVYFRAENSEITNKLSNELVIINKRIDVLMEEYKALRGEIMHHLQALHTIMNFSLAALVIGFTAVYNLYPRQGDPPPEMYFLFSLILLLMIPSTGSLMNFLWLVEAGDVGRIGYFLSRTEIEINSYFDRFGIFKEYELDIDYETSLRRIRRKYNVSDISSQGSQAFAITLFFIMIEIISIFAALWIIFNKLTLPSVPLYVCVTVFFCTYSFTLYSRFRKIWLNEKWYKALNLSRDDVLKLNRKATRTSRR